MNILLLCNYDLLNAATVCDHINSFYLYSKHSITICSCLVKFNGEFTHNHISFDNFDAIVLHYSIFLRFDNYISHKTRIMLQNFQGIKIIFIQDEYQSVNTMISYINQIGFDIIFTCVPKESIEQVYPATKLDKAKCINVLTGYVPHYLLSYPSIPLDQRQYDISYRGRQYPAWLGQLGLEKWQISYKFTRDAKKFNLKCNISCEERDRLYGSDWIKLLQNSVAVLGVESGASFFDFNGDLCLTSEIYEHLIQPRPSLLKKLFQNKEATLLHKYEIVKNKYLKNLNSIYYAQISPRIFEATALKTLCILYEGRYSDILTPWRHFVPLKKDHSNMNEIIEVLSNKDKVAEIILNAYKEIALNPKYSYRNFIHNFDEELEKLYKKSNNKVYSGKPKPCSCFYFINNPHLLHKKLSQNILSKIKKLIINYL